MKRVNTDDICSNKLLNFGGQRNKTRNHKEGTFSSNGSNNALWQRNGSKHIITKADLFKVSASANEYSDSNFKYDVIDGKVTITKYLGTSSIVTIRATIDGKPVVAIGSGAFDGCKQLSSVKIPSGVQ